MTTAPTLTRRLLDGAGTDHGAHLARYGVLPRLSRDDLLAALTDSGLTGRGGAGFPTAIKVRAVAYAPRRPVVIGNAMESEPLSAKDAVLLGRNPHLVLDGLETLARAMRARRAILALGPEVDPGAAFAAARGREVEVVQLEGGFVAGQETALVNQLNGRPAIPRDPFTRVTEAGVGGRDPGPQRRDAGAAGAARPVRRGLVPGRGHHRGPRHVPLHDQRIRGPAGRGRGRARQQSA